LLTQFRTLDIGECARDTLVGVVHRPVDRRTVLRGEPVFLVPDVERRFLKGNRVDVFVLELDHGIHCSDGSPLQHECACPNGNRPLDRPALLPPAPQDIVGGRSETNHARRRGQGFCSLPIHVFFCFFMGIKYLTHLQHKNACPGARRRASRKSRCGVHANRTTTAQLVHSLWP
jgi:hypothetical protein